jgi:hypothetical protein
MGVSYISSVDPESLCEPKLPFKTHENQICDTHLPSVAKPLCETFLFIINGESESYRQNL